MAKKRNVNGEKKRKGTERPADINPEVVTNDDFFAAWKAAEGPAGRNRDEAIWRMRAIASSGAEFPTMMCTVYYASGCSRHDPLEALRWAIKGMESGDERAASWLAFFLMRDDDPDPCRKHGCPEQDPRPRGDGWFDPDPYLLVNPAFRVLLSLTCTDEGGSTFLWEYANHCYGFENDLFSFIPGNPDDVKPGESCWATFIHRPSGLKLVWRGSFQDAAVNIPVTVGECARIWLDCIASVVGGLSRRGPDDDPELIPAWRGHPRVILEREEGIRRALRLPTDDFFGDDVLGRADRIVVSSVRAGGTVRMSFGGGRALTVDGRAVRAERSAAERLFYAAGLADPKNEGVFGNPRADGAEWRVYIDHEGGTLRYGGTVMPPFISVIVDAMEGLSDAVPGLRSLLDSLSVFPRAPCRLRSENPPRPEYVYINRMATGEEVAGSGCRAEWQELTVDGHGAKLRTSFCGARGSSTSLEYAMEVDPAAAEAFLGSFDGRTTFCADPSDPCSFYVDRSTGVWEFAGPDEPGAIASMRDLTRKGMEGLEDRINSDLREKGLLAEGEVVENPILVFDITFPTKVPYPRLAEGSV